MDSGEKLGLYEASNTIQQPKMAFSFTRLTLYKREFPW